MYKGPKRKFKQKNQRSKPSEYALQLVEKQKLRKAYSVRERILKTYFSQARTKRVDIDTFLVQELERRLDNVVFRLGWAQTRPQAAQFVNHAHIQVNGKRVNIPSYQVKKGDKITIKESKKKLHTYKSLEAKLAKHTPPAWMQYTHKDKTQAEILGDPTKGDFTEPVNLSLVLEFYSR